MNKENLEKLFKAFDDANILSDEKEIKALVIEVSKGFGTCSCCEKTIDIHQEPIKYLSLYSIIEGVQAYPVVSFCDECLERHIANIPNFTALIAPSTINASKEIIDKISNKYKTLEDLSSANAEEFEELGMLFLMENNIPLNEVVELHKCANVKTEIVCNLSDAFNFTSYKEVDELQQAVNKQFSHVLKCKNVNIHTVVVKGMPYMHVTGNPHLVFPLTKPNVQLMKELWMGKSKEYSFDEICQRIEKPINLVTLIGIRKYMDDHKADYTESQMEVFDELYNERYSKVAGKVTEGIAKDLNDLKDE